MHHAGYHGTRLQHTILTRPNQKRHAVRVRILNTHAYHNIETYQILVSFLTLGQSNIILCKFALVPRKQHTVHICSGAIALHALIRRLCCSFELSTFSAYLQVLGFKDGPGLRVLVLAACCFLAYAASCLACKVFA